MSRSDCPTTTDRPKWFPGAAIVISLMVLCGACASDDSDDAPATTAVTTLSTTADPAEGPQPSLEPGSNLPPDEDPNEPASPTTDDSSGTGTAETSTENTGG
jgi:hypothetical protein